MALGMYYQKALLNTLGKHASPGAGAPIQSPSTLRLSLHTDNPTADHAVALTNELTSGVAGAYARYPTGPDPDVETEGALTLVLHEDDAGNIVPMEAATQSTLRNNFYFQLPAATNDWPPFTHYALWRVTTDGVAEDYLFFGALPIPIDLKSGERYMIQGPELMTPGKFRIGVK